VGHGHRALNLVTRDRIERYHPNCGPTTDDYVDADPGMDLQATELDIRHLWHSQTTTSQYTLDLSTTTCTDRSGGYVATVQSGGDKGLIRACWRYKGGPDEIHCATSTANGTYAVDPLNNFGVHQEHVALVLDGGDRVAVHRSRESDQWRIRARFVDDVSDPDVVIREGDTNADERFGQDYPDFNMTSTGRYFAVWHEDLDAGNSEDDNIYASRCRPGTEDCTDENNWNTQVVRTSQELRHVHTTSDGDRLFIAYMEDIDSDPGEQTWRIAYQTKCATDTSWSAPDYPHEPATVNSTWDQSTGYGRSAVAADRTDNVFHVVFAEGDEFLGNSDPWPDDADIYWASIPYTDCP
jgi:hypothetical protein